jgi:hypothetical protein
MILDSIGERDRKCRKTQGDRRSNKIQRADKETQVEIKRKKLNIDEKTNTYILWKDKERKTCLLFFFFLLKKIIFFL